jgi:hypothetical protein
MNIQAFTVKSNFPAFSFPLTQNEVLVEIK